jgi:hypothetical protein
MHVGPTFCRREVDETLLSHGYTPGTEEWRLAFCRNYIPVDDNAYAESDTFDLAPLQAGGASLAQPTSH